MVQMDTPPSSPHMEDVIEEDDLIYVGDADEILASLEAAESESEEEMEDGDQIRDDSTCVFTKHEGSVFCGSLNKNGTLAATGGEDDKAFVWDVATGEVVLECTGHQDSVIFAEFSPDGSYLATGDMTGVVQIWKMSTKLLLWDYNMGDMTWMRWHNVANILFGGATSGEIYMWKIPSGDCKILQSYGQRAETGIVTPDGKRLVVGYEDGAIRIWDLKTCKVLSTIPSDSGHSSSITVVDCHPDNNLIISAAVDGKTILTTSQSGKVIAILQDLKSDKTTDATDAEGDDNEAENSAAESKNNWVEAVAFSKDPGFQVAATGTLNGELFIWETSKHVPRHAILQDSGISKLAWKQASSVLFSSGLDGIARCFDARSGQLIHSFMGHSADILDISISGDGQTMLTTSDDSTARIFDISNYN